MAVQKVNVNGVVYDVEDKEGVEANAQRINDLKSGAEPAGIAHKLASGLVYRGYINEGTTLPSDDNSFYLTNDPGNYIDSEGNVVTVATEGVSLIQRKGGEWRVYSLWELVSELNNASSTRFASANAVKKLKDMIDQLAAQGGGSGGGGSVIVDSELSETSLNPVQNTVITAALNQLGKAIEDATAENSVTEDKIADNAVTEEKLSPDLSDKINSTKVVADKAAADIGADSTTLLQGGIDAGGSENASSYFLRTGRYSTFKLEVNSGYTIGQLAQYDLAGNFVALYNDYTQPIESVEWTPTSVIATDKNYSWVAIVFKGNSPSTAISPREAVVKTFASGLYYYIEGSESDPQSAAQQARQIVDRTIEQLPNEEDLTLVDGKMQIANRAAAVKDGKVANFGYIILRPEKSFAEQVTEPNCIYEIRYEFDLQGATVTLKEGCTLKFIGGKLSNGTIFSYRTRIDASPVEIFSNVTFTGNVYAKNLYIEWFGGFANTGYNNVNAMHAALNSGISADIQLLPKTYEFTGVHPDDVILREEERDADGNISKKEIRNDGFSILMRGNKTIRGYRGQTILKSSDNSLILAINSGNRIKDLRIYGGKSSNEDNTSIGIQLGVFAFSESEDIILDEETGVRYNKIDEPNSLYAIYGELSNVSTQQCDIGINLLFQWCNILRDFNSSNNRIGVICRATTPYIDNLVCELNIFGLIATNSGVSLYNSIFQANEIACKIDGKRNLLESCYFEGNISQEVGIGTSPYQGCNYNNPAVRQGSIICGTKDLVESLVLTKNNFVWGGELIYVDQCDNLSLIGKQNLSGLKLTKNCKTYSIDSDVPTSAASASSDRVSIPFFALKGFQDCTFAAATGKLVYYQTAKIRFIYSDCDILDDGSALIYRKDGSASDTARSFVTIFDNDYSFIDRNNDLFFVADVEIPATKSLRVQVSVSVTDASDVTTAYDGDNPICIYGSTKRFVRKLKKEDIDKYRDNFKSLRFDIHTYSTGVENDIFTSEEDDKNVNPLIIKGIYVYSGEVLTNESTDSYQPCVFKADFVKPRKTLSVPKEKIDDLNFDDIKIIYSETSRRFVPISRNKYIAPSGLASNDYAQIATTLPTVADGDKAALKGYCVYDGKNDIPMWWNGTAWVDATGQPNVKSSGTTSERPTGISAGFQYFDTTLSKPIWWTAEKWIDSTGTEV